MLAKSKQDSILANVSRRGFMKATAALGASAALYGCGGSSDDPIDYIAPNDPVEKPDLSNEDYFHVMGGHNCGTNGGCVSKAWVKNGRITRVTSFAEEVSANGANYGPDEIGNPLQRSCGRCRANKLRIHHPGRLKYPLKQTKLRGDLTGFVRISWEEALNEITRKHKAIINKYGPESIHSLYACGAYTTLQGGGYYGIWSTTSSSIPLNYVGGVAQYAGDYSYHQSYSWENNYVGAVSTSLPSVEQIAGGTIKNIISFGDNSMSSRHNKKQAMVSAYKSAKANGTNIIYIAPEFVDTGVNIADEFIPTKPYTTAALMTGMLHEMLINTFNADGTIKSDAWLDVEYLDAAVYGFFDSPKYWIKKGSSGSPAQGTIQVVDPATSDSANAANYTEIDAVAPGMSWSAYIMGDDDRLTKARYDAVKNYVANKYAPVQAYRNMALCNQPVALGANTAFIRKKEYRKAKTADWASKITGIPAQRIRELAKMYCDTTQHPIYHTYGYGMEKQLDGIMNRFTLSAFMTVTKTYGMVGHGINVASGGSNGFTGSSGTAPANRVAMPSQTITRPSTPASSANVASPILSVTQWHNAIRMAFMDVMLDPNKGPVYTAKHIPDYKPTVDFKSAVESKDLSTWKSYVGRVYNDDGGAKALVKLQRDSYPSGTPLTESTTAANLYVTDGDKPVYSGYRWIINSGGNIIMNQHMNPNDTAEMLRSIPSCGQTNDPDNPDDLCIISFDNFLSPSPRYSDYVLPAKALWEQVNYHSAGGQYVLIPGIVKAPGECKDSFDFAVAFLKAYEKIRPDLAGMALQFTGHDNVTNYNKPIEGDTYLAKFQRAYARAQVAGTANGFKLGDRYYGKSFDEALKVQYEPPLPATITPTKGSTALTGVRATMENYVAELKLGTKGPNDIIYPDISTSTGNRGHGSQYKTGTNLTAPGRRSPGRFMVYTAQLQWAYTTRYEAWHKYLEDKGLPSGQRPDDIEGDPIIPVIPMYFNYEDSFMEAYGGPERMKEMPEDRRFLVTTTHTIHRAHSSVAESPLVREVTHRVRGGGEHSGNDWQTYALSNADSDGAIPRLNSAIDGGRTDFRRASWTEVLMNEKDGARLGIKSGDIIEMRNPVGAVRVSVKLTKRAAKGYIALNQGAWYDPDPVDGVDDGGCANTLMCTRGSRLDHGNGQQSAMVSVKKVY